MSNKKFEITSFKALTDIASHLIATNKMLESIAQEIALYRYERGIRDKTPTVLEFPTEGNDAEKET
jgi:hypothetical protein